MIFARKEIKMNDYRKQSPEIKTTISHDDKTVTVYLYHGEQIKCVPEFPNYHITSEGRVWSWYANRFLSPSPLKSGKNGKCYVQYCLIDKNGKPQTAPAQRFVWMAYGDTPLEKGSHIHHINGDSLDNRIENLVQLTPEEHKKQFESPYLIITKRPNRELTLKRGWEFLKEDYEVAFNSDDAAKILGMTKKEVAKLVKGLDRSGTGNPSGCAPDGRFVIRFENVYPPFSVLDSQKKR